MKKAQILQVFLRRFVIASVMVLGLMVGSTMSAHAQQLGSTDYYIQKLTDVRPSYVDLQQSFTPGSAKWDAVGDLIAHIDVVVENLSVNPNYLAQNDGYAVDRKHNPVWLKTHPSILREFSTAQLTAMQQKLDEMIANGESATSYQKLELILAVNAY